MFVTALTLYLVATQGLQLTGWILLGVITVDLVAWTAVRDVFESWRNGTRTIEWRDE